jgi:hypothetical protein
MHQKLTDKMIETAALELIAKHRRVTLRMLTSELQRRHSASGRNARVGRILREVASRAPAADAAALSRRVMEAEQALQKAVERAERAEERERAHQDLWGRRWAEKADELERRYEAALQRRANITVNEYLRLRQELAATSRRLAEYEAREAARGERGDK